MCINLLRLMKKGIPNVYHWSSQRYSKCVSLIIKKVFTMRITGHQKGIHNAYHWSSQRYSQCVSLIITKVFPMCITDHHKDIPNVYH